MTELNPRKRPQQIQSDGKPREKRRKRIAAVDDDESLDCDDRTTVEFEGRFRSAFCHSTQEEIPMMRTVYLLKKPSAARCTSMIRVPVSKLLKT